MEYRGQIAIASIFDVVDDAYYKYVAKIETGNLSKKECYVAYRGNPDKLKGNVVVRFELPFEEISNLNLDGVVTSHFVTSTPPKDFESASSNDVIFYGLWEERMHKGFDVPIIGKIRNYYDIGIIQSALHYAYKDRKIFSYRLYGRIAEVLQYGSRGETLRIRNALDKYLRKIEKLRERQLIPKLVTIDEEINLESRILNTLAETLFTLVEMEPQQ